MEKPEIWVKHKKWPEKYLVSSKGRLYSYITEKLLSPSLGKDGYLTYSGILGSVHRIVAENFLGGIPEGLVVNHLDGNKQNNDLDNLEITTHAENVRHAYRLGLIRVLKGEEKPTAKLKETDVLEMYQLFNMGFSNDDIGKQFNVHARYVSLIRHGKRWIYLYEQETRNFPKSYNFKTRKENILIAITALKAGKTNIEASILSNIEKSLISRLRTGKASLWIEWYEVFHGGPQRLSKAIS